MKPLQFNWLKPSDFWRLPFVDKKFNAIICVQYKNPPYAEGYECLNIFKWKSGPGAISIDTTLDKMKFDEFNPEKDYLKLAVLEYQINK